mgnify:CR=1 FL=1
MTVSEGGLPANRLARMRRGTLRFTRPAHLLAAYTFNLRIRSQTLLLLCGLLHVHSTARNPRRLNPTFNSASANRVTLAPYYAHTKNAWPELPGR